MAEIEAKCCTLKTSLKTPTIPQPSSVHQALFQEFRCHITQKQRFVDERPLSRTTRTVSGPRFNNHPVPLLKQDHYQRRLAMAQKSKPIRDSRSFCSYLSFYQSPFAGAFWYFSIFEPTMAVWSKHRVTPKQPLSFAIFCVSSEKGRPPQNTRWDFQKKHAGFLGNAAKERPKQKKKESPKETSKSRSSYHGHSFPTKVLPWRSFWTPGDRAFSCLGENFAAISQGPQQRNMEKHMENTKKREGSKKLLAYPTTPNLDVFRVAAKTRPDERVRWMTFSLML